MKTKNIPHPSFTILFQFLLCKTNILCALIEDRFSKNLSKYPHIKQ